MMTRVLLILMMFQMAFEAVGSENCMFVTTESTTCAGDATIILDKGTTNKVMGGYENYPGIYVPEGKALKGSGTLESSGQGWSAGIGGDKNAICGRVTIADGV